MECTHILTSDLPDFDCRSILEKSYDLGLWLIEITESMIEKGQASIDSRCLTGVNMNVKGWNTIGLILNKETIQIFSPSCRDGLKELADKLAKAIGGHIVVEAV